MHVILVHLLFKKSSLKKYLPPLIIADVLYKLNFIRLNRFDLETLQKQAESLKILFFLQLVFKSGCKAYWI